MEDRDNIFRRLPIHLFTSEENIENESLILSGFLAAGLDFLHIRKPNADCYSIRNLIKGIPQKYRDRIVIHSYPELAQEFGTGVQINSRCPNPEESSLFISKSCHSIEEANNARDFTFVTLSPIFDSISKEGYISGFSEESLISADLRNVVALGGITLEKIPVIKRLGFGGAALLGDVWRRDNGMERLLKYLRMRNFPLQFITDAPDVSTSTEQARHALRGGCRWIQVRMKHAPKDIVADALREILPLCEDMGTTLIVDDHVELAALCHGVHLGQNDTPVSEARKMLPPEKIIGLTANNVTHINESHSSLPDYYGIGPYRFTSTKKNLSPLLGLEGYRKLAPSLQRPFVAIGGVLPSDITGLISAGASGIAVSSVINRAESPENMTKTLLNELSCALENGVSTRI